MFPTGGEMAVLVTGGAGFIGRHLVRRLVDADEDVVVVDSGETGRLLELPPQVRSHRLDIAVVDRRDWIPLLDGVDRVFHLAARKYNTPGVTPGRTLGANASATLALSEAVRAAGVPRMVYTSSLYAYGALGPSTMSEEDLPAPWTVYGASKLAGEHLMHSALHGSGSSAITARLFFVYGPGQYAEGGYKSVIVANFERMMQGQPPIIRGDGAQRLDYVFVEDVVDALVRMAEPDGPSITVNVGSGSGVSVLELTELMRSVAGFQGEAVFEAPDWTAGTSRVGNVQMARDALGWAAAVPLREGLERTWLSLSR